MDYYLVIPNEEGMLLGTQSFGFFYAEQGFDFLTDLINKKPELIEFVKIITDAGTEYTVEQFLSMFDEEGGIQMRRRS